MKKVVGVCIAACLASTALMGATGKVKSVWVKSDRAVIRLDTNDACRVGTGFNMDADFVKSMIASALTAQAAGSTVVLNFNGANCTDMLIK